MHQFQVFWMKGNLFKVRKLWQKEENFIQKGLLGIGGLAFSGMDIKYYDLNGNGLKNDFFVSTRTYGGEDLGMWKIVQTVPNDLSSYKVENSECLNLGSNVLAAIPKKKQSLRIFYLKLKLYF